MGRARLIGEEAMGEMGGLNVAARACKSAFSIRAGANAYKGVV